MPAVKDRAAKTPPSVERRKLVQSREESYAALKAVKRQYEVYENETEEMRAQLTVRQNTHDEEFEGPTKRPKQGTEAAKLRDQIMVRMRGSNPHQEAYDAALAEFHRHDITLRKWKQRNLEALLAERQAAKEAAAEKIRDGAVLMHEGTQEYAALQDQDRDDIIETPPLNGQDVRYDPRVDGWARQAAEIRDAAIVLPG